MRSRYGGVLRVEVQSSLRTLDPAATGDDFDSSAGARLVGLVFEGLVRLDEGGRPQPALATSWESAPGGKRWLFHLRPGVKFHDGSVLSPAAVVAALDSPGNGWEVSPAADGVRIRSDHPLSELLSDLAQVRHAIILRVPGGAISGTGPFRIAEWQADRSALLKANEEYWQGRPFLDAISIDMGRTLRQQMLDLELGKADMVEMAPNESRRSSQAMRVWNSAPVTLLALTLERNRPAGADARLREALALSIDRAAVHTVLLQKQGEPAAALLPQWLSGYAFLFSTARDIGRARQLAASLPAQAAPLSLGYDSSDPVARAVAERVAVNAREAGIRIQTSTLAQQPDLRIMRVRASSSSPGAALVSLAASLGLQDLLNLTNLADPEARYASERGLVEEHRVIPLMHLPDVYAVRPAVHSWLRPGVLKTGEWRLEDVWLGPERP